MPVTILVAEDSVTMRRIVEMTFAGEKDVRVVSVDNGDAAVQKANELRPDVVIADGSLPGMDGYEIARAIKSAHANTAVILMASQKHPYDDSRGKANGIDDHIIKPFDTQHMIDRVQQVLGKPRAQAQGAQPAPKPMAAPVAAAPVAQPKPSPVGLASPVAKPAPIAAPPVSVAPVPKAAPVAAAAPVRAAQPAPSKATAAATAPNGDLAAKLTGLGLTADQVNGVLKLSREVIEQVVWEVVPDLAETIIREEISRLTAE